MPSPTAALLWWAFRLSLLAGCLAVAVGVLHRQHHPPIPSPSPPQIFCYEGLRPDAQSPTDESAAACFEVANGLFVSVGASAAAAVGANAEVTKPTPKRKLKGYALPGLWDGHGHLLAYGEFLHSADLFGSESLGDVRERLAQYLTRNPGAGTREEWARGVGWDQMSLGGMPTAAALEADPRLKGKYFMLDRVDVHCTWVSQAVLDLLPRDLPDVPGGEIVRSPGMGVFCDNAMDVVVTRWPKPGRDRKRAFVKAAMRELNKVGIVGMHDAGVQPRDVALYEEASEDEKEWTVRVYAMIECEERNTFCPDEAVKIAQASGMLSVRSVKLFADGALGSWGSAMIEPYSDRPDTSGSLLVNASTLTSLTRSWSQAGFQVNIHAIGDLANRYAVDAIQAALAGLSANESPAACQANHRFRIEHAQIIHPDDQKRMRTIGITPSIQPTHATSDMAYAERRLGPARITTEAYRMRSLLDLHPVLGSDFPVEPPNPLEGLYAAVARKNPRTGLGPPGAEKGWHMEEALSLEQALAGFTQGAARGAFLEGKAGVIREGAYADWIVLDEPLEKVGVEGLRGVKVRETWVGGRLVYSREDDEDGFNDL